MIRAHLAVLARCARQNLPRDGGQRQDEVGHPGGNGTQGHAGILRALRLLDDGHASLLLDRPEAQRAIGSRAGEDHAGRALSLVLRQRLEEVVDRQLGPVAECNLGDPQTPGPDVQVAARWAEVDAVGVEQAAVDGLAHGHHGGLAQQLGQQARVPDMLMRDDHEAQAGVGRHVLQQFEERFESACRGADPDDRRKHRLLPADRRRSGAGRRLRWFLHFRAGSSGTGLGSFSFSHRGVTS